MKNWSLLLLLLSVCYSCGSVKPQRQVTQTVTTQRDSTATHTREIDSLMVVRPPDMASIEKAIAQLTAQGITTQSGSATLTVGRQGNNIVASCECAELKQAVKLYEKIIEHWLLKNTVTETETTVTETKTPGWAKPFLYIGIALVVFMGITTVKKFI